MMVEDGKSTDDPVRSSLALSSQVVYPALDSKVKNVTLAYSVEHQDEVSV